MQVLHPNMSLDIDKILIYRKILFLLQGNENVNTVDLNYVGFVTSI